MAPPAHSGGGGGGGRRPSLYRDEAPGAPGGSKLIGALAPPEGVDAAFDARVLATAARKSLLRDAVWAKLGGSGSPAAPGELAAFDAAVKSAWVEVQERHRLEKEGEGALAAAAAAGTPRSGGAFGGGSGGGGGDGGARTPFDSDVAAEMARLEAELLAELDRTSPAKARPAQQGQQPLPRFQHKQQPSPQQEPYQQHQQYQQPPFQHGGRAPFSRGGGGGGSAAPHSPVRAPPITAPWLPRASDAVPQPSPHGQQHQQASLAPCQYQQQCQQQQQQQQQQRPAAPWLQPEPSARSAQPPQQQQAAAALTGRRGQFSGRGASSLTFG